jgi:ferredoxin
MFIFQLWKYLDNEIEMTPMPPEYRDFKAEILCKDCHEVCISQAIRYSYIFNKSARYDRV